MTSGEKKVDMFLGAYKSLNSAQKEAVDTIEGPVMVIAGPGTGKTQILTLRIANILRTTDTPPDAILALTFTEAAASNIRARLIDLIGVAAYRVHIHTFHGYATEVITQHPESFPRIIGSNPIDEADQLIVIREALTEAKSKLLVPPGNPDFYLASIKASIGALKSDIVTPEEYRKRIKDREADIDEKKLKSVERSYELADVYEAYEKLLRKKRVFDFADMLVELVRALESDEDLRLVLGESAQYILADEHQDANDAQNRVLELLSSFHENPNLFIVGDEKQAIFRFQGASLENFLYFQKKHTGATVISLTENYRSPQTILDAAHSMIGKMLGEIPRPRLIAKSGGEGKPIDCVEAVSEEEEVAYVVGEIESLIKRGIKPEDIALITRRNSDVDIFAHALRNRHVPYRIASDSDALEDGAVNELLLLLSAIVDPSNNESLSRALLLPAFGLPTAEVMALLAERKQTHIPLYKILGEDKRESVARAWGVIETLSKRAQRENALRVFDAAVAESGFLSEVFLAEDLERALGAYRTLRKFLNARAERDREYRLADFLALLNDAKEGAVRLKTNEGTEAKGVNLLTAHRAKGLEYEYVFIVRATDSRFSARSDRTFFVGHERGNVGEDEDERRLLYVALTRAKKHTVVTWAKYRSEGKEDQPSRFLIEIDESLMIRTVAPEQKVIIPATMESKKSVQVERERESLIERFYAQGLSVSALNNYLRDPWEFFFRNVLQLPESPAPHQMYGIAMHEAITTFSARYASGDRIGEIELVTLFRDSLSKCSLSEREREQYEERGCEALRGYYAHYQGNFFVGELKNEYRLSAQIEVGARPLLLHGFLDAVEFHKDGVRVIDYKTGAPKSRNHIEGKTKDSDGAYKRQLVFYKLLLELQDPKLTLKEAVLDFLEPTPAGKYKQESFNPSEEEIETVKKEIAAMLRDIATLSFLSKPSLSEDPSIRALSEVVRGRFN